jgi:glycine cleavage system H protein
LFSPVSGTVTEINEELNTAPEKVNQDPYGAWMIKVRVKNPQEIKELLSASDYEQYANERAEK